MVDTKEKRRFDSLKVIDKKGSKLNGHSMVAVNPAAFVSAWPVKLNYEEENTDPETLHGMAMKEMDVVHMRFSQGEIWDEYDVEPEEAYRFLGFWVKKLDH